MNFDGKSDYSRILWATPIKKTHIEETIKTAVFAQDIQNKPTKKPIFPSFFVHVTAVITRACVYKDTYHIFKEMRHDSLLISHILFDNRPQNW